jgi:hypothetical protein
MALHGPVRSNRSTDPPNEHLAATTEQLRHRIADLEASSAVLDSVLDCLSLTSSDSLASGLQQCAGPRA